MADSSPSPELVTFTVFSKLPVEIQLKIWKVAVPEPRVIKVTVFAPDSLWNRVFVPHFQPGNGLDRASIEKVTRQLALKAEARSPGILFACHQSRIVALKTYTKCLELSHGKEARFDPSSEAVVVTHDAARGRIPPLPYLSQIGLSYENIFSGVETLAVGFDDVSFTPPSLMSSMLEGFKSLKTLVLLMNSIEPGTQAITNVTQAVGQLTLQSIVERNSRWEGITEMQSYLWSRWLQGWKNRITRPRDAGDAGKHLETLAMKPMFLVSLQTAE